MTTRTRRYQDQAIHAGFQRFLRMTNRNHIVQDDAAIAVDRIHHFLRRCPQ
ncbi:hypothetical protein D3C81_1824640 [compost metagenome]